MRKQKDMRPDARVPLIEKLGISLGYQGPNLYTMIISSFLLVYYTNVVGLGAGAVATVMGISKVLDGLSDIVAGTILDRTHTKYGKCRPWIVRMIIPTAVCAFLMFFVPAGFSNGLKLVYVFITYNLMSTICMTMNSVAWSSMNGSLSMDQRDRGINGGLMMFFGIVGGVVLNSTVLQIAEKVGGGDPYTQAGWTAMILIYTAAYVVLSIFGFFFTTERVTLANWGKQKESGTTEEEKKDDIPVLESLKILIHDKYWVIFVITMICVVYMQTGFGMSNVYFAQYVLGDVYLYTPLGNFLSISALIGSVVAIPLMAKIKKRNLCMMGLVSICIGAFLPLITHALPMLYASAVLKGLGTGAAGAILGGMLQDTITYAQWQSGKDVLGMGNAAYSFCNKIGSSIGTILFGWILDWSGFDGLLDVQPASAIGAINTLYIWIPGIAMILAIVCMYFYDLDNKYADIAADLKKRMGLTENGAAQEPVHGQDSQ